MEKGKNSKFEILQYVLKSSKFQVKKERIFTKVHLSSKTTLFKL